MNNHSSLANWIKEEFSDISFNDNRLTKRFEKVAQGLAEKSEKKYKYRQTRKIQTRPVQMKNDMSSLLKNRLYSGCEDYKTRTP